MAMVPQVGIVEEARADTRGRFAVDVSTAGAELPALSALMGVGNDDTAPAILTQVIFGADRLPDDKVLALGSDGERAFRIGAVYIDAERLERQSAHDSETAIQARAVSRFVEAARCEGVDLVGLLEVQLLRLLLVHH